MEHYKALASIAGDKEAMAAHVATMDASDLVDVLQLLVQRQKCRDDAADAYKARTTAEHGVARQWHYVRTNPDAYARKLAYNREYRARKRAQATDNPQSS